MRIAVIGAGGVGGYFGARMAAAGCDVTFIARGEHLKAIQRDGLRVESALGDLHVRVAATNDPAEVGPVDYVWIAVKLWDTEAAALSAKPMIGPATTVISFQNGVEKDDVLAAALPEAHRMGGVCYLAATIARPGVIVQTGTMARLVFGEFSGERSSKTTALADACGRAGVTVEVPPDIRVATWLKFIFLVGLSATTTAMRVPVGTVRSNPRSRQLLIDLVHEAVAVARARGIALDDAEVKMRVSQLEQAPAAMTSSMHQDLKRGNRLEVEWLSGAVVRLGEQTGVPTPLNRAIRDVLAPWADGTPAES